MTRRERLERMIKAGDLLYHIGWTDARMLITELFALWELVDTLEKNPKGIDKALEVYLENRKAQ